MKQLALTMLLVISTVTSEAIFGATATLTPSDTEIGEDIYVDLGDLEILETDVSLFATRLGVASWDHYGSLVKFYRAGGSGIAFKRRGLDWWATAMLDTNVEWGDISLAQPTEIYSARIATQSGDYRYGANIYLAVPNIFEGWDISAYASYRTGRNSLVEGCFTNDLYSGVTASHRFGRDAKHYILVDLSLPWTMRGLQSSATKEAYSLTANRYYNPSWGLYHGEVRNSRVARRFLPKLDLRYQRQISATTTAAVAVNAEYGTKLTSRLGWYDAYNPSPDYYRKMPSYLNPQSEAYTLTRAVWQSSDTDYTQINWDRLESENAISPDGEAHYTVEDAVERVADINISALFTSHIYTNLKLNYGATYIAQNSRHYKQMRDLLGADYLLDIDQYADDGVSVSNNLQNNLRNPNRHITVGDRFGYDYSLISNQLRLMGGVEYSAPRFLWRLDLQGGNLALHRTGHYEVEKFSGAASYGDSAEVSLSDYAISTALNYSLGTKHLLSIKGDYHVTPPQSSDIFIDSESANYVVEDPQSEEVASLMLGYRYSRWGVNISATLSAIVTSNASQLFGSYDDLSGEFCNAVISGVATSNINAEIASEISLSRSLTLTSTLSIGSYTYSSAPNVKLYNSNDMTLIADTQAIAIEGCIVGNTPQITATSGVRYYGGNGFILALNGSYAGSRYVAPSILRRTVRIGAITPSYVDIWTQEKLDDILDFELSAVKMFWIGKDGNRLTITARIKNLLGENNRITYAREANRLLTKSYYGVEYARYAQPSTYTYGAGREFYLSVGYRF
ncbi:MAG: hypothetical protein SNH01_01470 [Rikenellaceae bacterium]